MTPTKQPPPPSPKTLFLRQPNIRARNLQITASTPAPHLKCGVYGLPGTGKTGLIADLLALGFKIFLISTDLGGSGASAIFPRLKLLGKPETRSNLKETVISDYRRLEDTIDLIATPDQDYYRNYLVDDGKPLWEWGPQILVWDGFSNAQTAMFMEYILSLSPSTNDKAVESEMRSAGLRADDWRDFDALQRLSKIFMNKFGPISNPITGEAVHKIVTMHEKIPRSLTNEDRSKMTAKQIENAERIEPDLTGAFGDKIGAAFDAYIRTSKSFSPGRPPSFTYDISTLSVESKDRFYGQLPPRVENVKPGDFGKLWTQMLEVLGA